MTCRCIKKDGIRCRYKPKPGSEFCGVHAKCSNREASPPARASPARASPARASPARSSLFELPVNKPKIKKTSRKNVKNDKLELRQKEAEKHIALLKNIRAKSEADRVREEKEKISKYKKITPRENLELYQKGKLVNIIENLEMVRAMKWIDLNSNTDTLFYQKDANYKKKLDDVVHECALEMFRFITLDLCNRMVAEEKLMPIAVACLVIAVKIIGAYDIDYSDTLSMLSKRAKCKKSVVVELEKDILRRTNWLGCKGTLDITRFYD